VIRPTRMERFWDGYTGYVEITKVRLERPVMDRGGLEVMSSG